MKRFVFFDPGESTGYCITDDKGNIVDKGTIADGNFNAEIIALFDTLLGTTSEVIIESFQLYPWKAKAKSWSSFPEVEKIGIIKFLCYMRNINYIVQKPAQKDTYDNDLIRYILGEEKDDEVTRHTFDAIRHSLVYFTSRKEEWPDAYINTMDKIKNHLLSRR